MIKYCHESILTGCQGLQFVAYCLKNVVRESFSYLRSPIRFSHCNFMLRALDRGTMPIVTRCLLHTKSIWQRVGVVHLYQNHSGCLIVSERKTLAREGEYALNSDIALVLHSQPAVVWFSYENLTILLVRYSLAEPRLLLVREL